MPVELHCHSTASDGELPPAELVPRALAQGITTLALTDHDTVNGLPELLEAARDTDLRIVPGVELSCHYEGREVHLLGYFFEHRDPDFLDLLLRMQEERRGRVHKILAKLEALGVQLSYEEVQAQSAGGTLGRPHVAKAMVARGVVSSMDLAFDLYLGNRAPAYVGRSLLSLPDGIEAVRRAGGCSVLAHPGLLNDWAMVERIMHLPVNGVEVWHPSHNKASRKRSRRLGGRYQKVLSGGSDFHRPSGEHELGSSREVTEKVVTRLREAASKGEHPVAS
jgi:predicted metal-dependent phosphoesterase TrpH